MKLGRAVMLGVPHQPREGHARSCARPLPSGAVHHRKVVPEDVDACELTAIENRSAPLALKEGQPQEHDHFWAEVEGVSHKLRRQLEGRIRHDRLSANGQLTLEKKIQPDASWSGEL